MKWNIGNKFGGLIAFAVIAFFSFGTMSYLMINQLETSVDWNNHSHVVMNTNELIISDLKDAETGQRGYVITGDEKYLEPYTAARESIYNRLDELVKLTQNNPIQQTRLKEYKKLIDEKLSELEEVIVLRKEEGFESAQSLVSLDVGKKIMDDFRRVSDTFIKEEADVLATRELSMKNNSRKTKMVIIYGSLLAIILLSIIGYFLIRDIANPLNKVTDVASRISTGDLTMKLKTDKRKDEVGLLNNVFYDMIKKLRKSIEEITEGINTLGSSSSEILAATTQVSAGAIETATAINQTTTTVEEVRQASQLSSQRASHVAENANEISTVVQSGNMAVAKTGDAINLIQAQMETIASTIVRLSEQSQQIGGIIASVNDVADQSNLLAVNAAIEAAKAGEHGKGFAIVAQEIKNLAQLSKQATTKVRTILSDVQKATTAAVIATEQGTKAVADGVKQSLQAGESIKILSESVNESVQAATQIVASSQQQVVGMDQLGIAMQSINQAGAENSASMKQAENAAKELKELGITLKSLVDQYKL